MKKIDKIKLLITICVGLIFTGCTSKPQTTTDGQPWQDNWTTVGKSLGIEVPEKLVLLDNNDTLAADGMYYASWGIGNFVPYKNSDGDDIDLYDAQLYLLTNEATSGEKAKTNCDTWLSAAKSNYKIQSENTLNINGQDYTLLKYVCNSKDNPYDRGISAFGIYGTTAVCAELTCVENYTEDLETLLISFLNGCHFSAD